jgi:hypothetical protein
VCNNNHRIYICGEIALGWKKKHTMADAETLFPDASTIDLSDLRKEPQPIVASSQAQNRAQGMIS